MRLIDADELIKTYEKETGYKWNEKGILLCPKCFIDNAPTVDISGNEYFPFRTAYFNGVKDGRATARPKGEWVEVERQGKTGDGRVFTYTIVVCSECGEQYDIEGEKFCPNCGADMRGKEE